MLQNYDFDLFVSLRIAYLSNKICHNKICQCIAIHKNHMYLGICKNSRSSTILLANKIVLFLTQKYCFFSNFSKIGKMYFILK